MALKAINSESIEIQTKKAYNIKKLKEKMPNKEEDSHFKLHLDSTQKSKTEHKSEPRKKSEKNVNAPKKRSAKEILKSAARQIIVMAIILVVGFLLLNWSAYYQIIKSEINQWLGRDQQSPLQELVEDPTTQPTENLELSSDPEVQKRQIPPLEMEIAPSDNRIIIPRIDQNIPIVRVSSANLINRDWDALENEMQDALRNGVVHYPGTALPGQTGNIAITGHSSYFPWDSGRFKDVFALLHQVVNGDRIVIYYEQDKYVYEVDEIDIVLPENLDILRQTPDDRLTLITCTPVGTNLKRLIVIARPVSVNGQAVEQRVER